MNDATMRWVQNGAPVESEPGETYEDTVARALRQQDADEKRAGRAIESLLEAGRSLQSLRKRAYFTLRCEDCDGRVVGFACTVASRRMLWVAQKWSEARGQRLWVDDTLTSEIAASCRKETYLVDVTRLKERHERDVVLFRVSHAQRGETFG